VTPIEPLEITAGGLHLRPLGDGDVPDVLRGFADPDVARWQSAVPVASVEEARAFVARRRERWAEGSGASFAVVDATGGTFLGLVAVQQIDPVQRCASVGYWTLPEARGRGIAPQAVRVVSRWAFGPLGVERIELCHAVANPASCRVAEKAGYLLEGTLRKSFRSGDGCRHDEHLHARLGTDGSD
jgi:RimJ/RimL family protein N-acetyltransferase